ncbi:MAG TPA: hydroxymyristoyl-ACP dehydratase [Burkholderiales bacterium]|nr:hydroxymyristoyl-ACP dehydratase [Burkholderiales bacterium]
MLMLRAEIGRHIPHSGSMCLLDELLEWDPERIVCAAHSHHAPDNPLRHDGRVRAVCGIEYAAQAMALHGSLTAAAKPGMAVGYLASVRDVVCRVALLDEAPGRLRICAQRLAAEEAGALYAFQIWADDQELLRGRAAVVVRNS